VRAVEDTAATNEAQAAPEPEPWRPKLGPFFTGIETDTRDVVDAKISSPAGAASIPAAGSVREWAGTVRIPIFVVLSVERIVIYE